MNREEIEQGMKCCNDFLCGECPYEKYDDKVSDTEFVNILKSVG